MRWRRNRRRLMLPVWLLFILLAPIGPAAAATLAASPSTLFLEPGETGRITVTVQSRPGEAIDQGRLVVSPRTGLSYRVVAGGRPSDGGTRAWLVEITSLPEFRSRARVDLRLDFRRGRARRTASASLRVRPEPATPVASQISMEVILDRDTLLERQQGNMILKLSNLGSHELAVTDARISAPFLTATPRPYPWPIAPHATRVEQIPLSIVSDASRPLLAGRHPVLVVVTVERTSPQRPWRRDVAASQMLGLGIPGLTELQGLVGVPSFLLLPGFLIVTCFMLVWRIFEPPAARQGEPRSLAFAWSPSLWVVAITLSGIVVALYPSATGLLLDARRDILTGFDLSDVIRVWFWSMGLGAAAAFLALVVLDLARRRRARREFVEMERPLSFLRRLKRMKLDHRFKSVTVGSGARLYLVTPDEAGDTVWSAPGIAFRAAPERDLTALADLIRGGTLANLLKHIEAEVKAGALTLEWRDTETERGPTRVPRTRFSGTLLDAASIVSDEPAQ